MINATTVRINSSVKLQLVAIAGTTPQRVTAPGTHSGADSIWNDAGDHVRISCITRGQPESEATIRHGDGGGSDVTSSASWLPEQRAAPMLHGQNFGSSPDHMPPNASTSEICVPAVLTHNRGSHMQREKERELVFNVRQHPRLH